MDSGAHYVENGGGGGDGKYGWSSMGSVHVTATIIIHYQILY